VGRIVLLGLTTTTTKLSQGTKERKVTVIDSLLLSLSKNFCRKNFCRFSLSKVLSRNKSNSKREI